MGGTLIIRRESALDRYIRLAQNNQAHILICFLIFLFAAALRLIYMYTTELPHEFEMRLFVSSGQALAYENSFTRLAVSRGPFYPLFLSIIIRLFGDSLETIRHAQIVVSSLTCSIVYIMGLQLSNRRVGLIGALLMCIYPPMIMFSVKTLTETFSIFMLYLSLIFLIHAIRAKTWFWFFISGFLFALTILTRVTLMTIIPFIILGLIISLERASFKQRVLYTTIFVVIFAVPLLAWNIHIPNSTFGGGGASFILDGLAFVTEPNTRGWAPEFWEITELSEFQWVNPLWWQDALSNQPLALLTAPLNLAFVHLLYPEVTWHTQVLSLTVAQTQFLHFIILMLAIPGLYLVGSRFRKHALLLAFALSQILLFGIKWIELRHNVPLMPIILYFAAVFVDDWLTRWRTNRQAAIQLGIAWLITTSLAYLTLQASLNFIVLSGLPIQFNQVGIFLTIALPVALITFGLLCWCIFQDAGNPFALRLSVAVSTLSACAMVLSYLSVVSLPGWHLWSVSTSNLDREVTQEITLPQSLDVEAIESVEVLLDLATQPMNDTISLTLNDEVLPTAVNVMPYDLSPALSIFTSFHQLEPEENPRWWSIDITDFVDVLENQEIIELQLPIDSHLRLYGGAESDGAFHGPAVNTEQVSLYRWIIIYDWRMWDYLPLASTGTESYLVDNEGNRTPIIGEWHIRLLVTMKDGDQILY